MKSNAIQNELSDYEQYYRDEILTGRWENVWDIENPTPLVENAFHEQFTLFYLLCYLKKLKETKIRYQKLGIPHEIYVDTLSDIGVWLENWKERYGLLLLQKSRLDLAAFRCKAQGMLLHGPEDWGSQMYMNSYDNGYYWKWVEDNEQV